MTRNRSLPTNQIGRLAVCKLASVHAADTNCHYQLSSVPKASSPCLWRISVISTLNLQPHPLHLHNHTTLSPKENNLLTRLDGCNSTAQCRNEQVNCTYGIEDPSDAFWLREYNQGIKFVVMLKIASVSLIFYVAAILSDGVILSSHEQILPISTAKCLILISLSSFLYVVLVPRKMQAPLYGGTVLQTCTFLLIVLTAAYLLPAFALLWINTYLFLRAFFCFFLDQILTVTIGLFHYLGALSLFHAQYTQLCIRQIYLSLPEEQYNHRLVALSEQLVERMRSSSYLNRAPVSWAENEAGAIHAVFRERLYEDFDFIPSIEFESIERSGNEEARSEPDRTADERTALVNRNASY